MNKVCNCQAYNWPHRRTSGKCIWNPKHEEAHCEACGQACEYLVVTLDKDEGGGEACISKCCSDSVVLGGIALRAGDL